MIFYCACMCAFCAALDMVTRHSWTVCAAGSTRCF